VGEDSWGEGVEAGWLVSGEGVVDGVESSTVSLHEADNRIKSIANKRVITRLHIRESPPYEA